MLKRNSKRKLNDIEISEAKKLVLAFFKTFTAAHGFPPTMQEVASHYNGQTKNKKSLGAVQGYVRSLIKDGKLKRGRKRTKRNIALK